ncbi:glycosyltransferase family 4 protein [Staphylococcus sp. NRL 16/872]|uniref:glycosyltransferase family 4 protein n=1 Tax=Staphylococcus sp. NRL 16/872 TaxID=2930131 RepID=UPI001FB48CFD|nr:MULTISPECIES: glycosyltransferase family 4 protein [unclassified Staphylococcus]MCJ1655443.1 glycosyltransferase family 4 protein [Staphylococcus sp. NRL 21/187]MCJ1661278.1 glycosyltransferase family 4 protein [Staphylococcus sp. NRL 18/288]MCJ1667165.1 glycosyltransferase family 4 protein [Staphylococcus sp. NRL 19/737]WEN69648.1 glycosyltransferase family 4 protein [Staphylococcus sp. NRL 16/872]
MNIWIISDGEPLPTDSDNVRLRRMGNLTRILDQRGHKVIWFTSNFDHYNKKFRTESDEVKNLYNKSKLLLLSTKGYKKNVSLERYMHFKTFGQKFKHYANNLSKPDLILCTMSPIEVALNVKEYSKENKVPFIIDIRDLWPEIYYEVTPKISHPLINLLVDKSKRSLSRVLNSSNAVTGVTKGFVNYGLKISNLTPRKYDIPFHTAYPKFDLYYYKNRFEEFWGDYGLSREDFIVTFVGNFGKQFDLETLEEAIDKIQNLNIKFVLCGTGEKYDYFIDKYKDNKHVIIPGWVGKDEIASLIATSNIGIAPYKDSMNFRLNAPNKFGEYLSASLPILVSVSGVMSELLLENNCGYQYKSSNDLVNLINKYYETKKLQQEHAQNARDLFEKSFNAEKVYKDFSEYLETVAKF